ncbi:MAG: YaaL family protein [Firmicutes bacterium]|nr:YaaL family protein [Bacillota bacterium]
MGETVTEQINSQTFVVERENLAKEMISDIAEIKAELDSAVQNYNFADCDELIDHYSYKIKAAQTKYNMLLKRAKENGLTNAEYLANIMRHKK